jgi:integrase
VSRPFVGGPDLENDAMANLYKKPVVIVDPKTGKKVKTKSKKWWGRYRDEDNLVKRVPLATDKGAAQTMLNNLVIAAERRSAGITTGYEQYHRAAIGKHVDDFEKYLLDKGSTQDYASRTKSQVTAVLARTKVSKIGEISASNVQGFLSDLAKEGFGLATVNHYLTAIKMFTRWLVKDRRTADNRLAHLSKLNAETDRKYQRRPLTNEEFERLLKAAEAGESIQYISGTDRAILYLIAAYTGYRRNEIGSVTPQSFDFESEPPTMTVAAGYSKHRKTDVIPLRHDFAQRIQAWIAGKGKVPQDKPLIAVTGKRTGEMIQTDLAAARTGWLAEAKSDAPEQKRRLKSSFLAETDDLGRVVDFHALRMTFITNLTRSGVAPKTAQLLARHSDINLTMNTYTTLGVLDQAAAVEALPPIPTSEPTNQAQVARATGTDGPVGGNNGSKKVPTMVPSGAGIGAQRPASGELRIAPTCTEERPQRRSTRRLENAKSPEELGASRAASHHAARKNISGRSGDRTRTPLSGNGILSPVRLPISPSGLVVTA